MTPVRAYTTDQLLECYEWNPHDCRETVYLQIMAYWKQSAVQLPADFPVLWTPHRGLCRGQCNPDASLTHGSQIPNQKEEKWTVAVEQLPANHMGVTSLHLRWDHVKEEFLDHRRDVDWWQLLLSHALPGQPLYFIYKRASRGSGAGPLDKIASGCNGTSGSLDVRDFG